MTTPVWDRPRRMPLLPRILSGLIVVGIFSALVLWVFDLVRIERANASLPQPTAEQMLVEKPKARAEWGHVRANLTARLNQTNPLDLGAVWATRTGRVCGLVNGRGSFGGLSGMVRFYSADRVPVFHQDIDHLAFQHAWFQCNRDRWVRLHEGSEETGFCGTELGKRRCYSVRIVDGVRTVED
jgi:hypothetical protein